MYRERRSQSELLYLRTEATRFFRKHGSYITAYAVLNVPPKTTVDKAEEYARRLCGAMSDLAGHPVSFVGTLEKQLEGFPHFNLFLLNGLPDDPTISERAWYDYWERWWTHQYGDGQIDPFDPTRDAPGYSTKHLGTDEDDEEHAEIVGDQTARYQSVIHHDPFVRPGVLSPEVANAWPRRHAFPPTLSKAPKLRLTIDLAPPSSWYADLRRIIPRKAWDALRRKVCARGRCAICDGMGDLTCQEVWRYQGNVQRLVDLIPLCTWCHHIKNLSLANLLAERRQLNYPRLVQHFMEVNYCDEETFTLHRAKAYEQWAERATRLWRVDFGDFVLARQVA